LIALQNRDILQKIKLLLGFAELGQKAMVRTWSLAALAVGFWLLSAFGQSRPDALGLDAPAGQFSAARAPRGAGPPVAGSKAASGRQCESRAGARPHPEGVGG